MTLTPTMTEITIRTMMMLDDSHFKRIFLFAPLLALSEVEGASWRPLRLCDKGVNE